MRLKIERALQDELGAEVTVLLRTLSEVVGIVERDPFKKNRVPKAKPFVTFHVRGARRDSGPTSAFS